MCLRSFTQNESCIREKPTRQGVSDKDGPYAVFVYLGSLYHLTLGVFFLCRLTHLTEIRVELVGFFEGFFFELLNSQAQSAGERKTGFHIQTIHILFVQTWQTRRSNIQRKKSWLKYVS